MIVGVFSYHCKVLTLQYEAPLLLFDTKLIKLNFVVLLHQLQTEAWNMQHVPAQ